MPPFKQGLFYPDASPGVKCQASQGVCQGVSPTCAAGAEPSKPRTGHVTESGASRTPPWPPCRNHTKTY